MWVSRIAEIPTLPGDNRLIGKAGYVADTEYWIFAQVPTSGSDSAYFIIKKIQVKGAARKVKRVYNSHFHTCPSCGHVAYVCNCHRFFWNRECKHVTMLAALLAQPVEEKVNGE